MIDVYYLNIYFLTVLSLRDAVCCIFVRFSNKQSTPALQNEEGSYININSKSWFSLLVLMSKNVFVKWRLAPFPVRAEHGRAETSLSSSRHKD